MLERKYAIPVLFGLFLGLIFAGVQISATALNSVVGSHRDVILVSFENLSPKGADFYVLGKKVKVSLPEGPWGTAAERAEETAEVLAEKAGGLNARCREKAGQAYDQLAALAGRGKDSAMAVYRRWRDALGGLSPWTF